MRYVFGVYNNIEEANRIVKVLINDGYSAYRQGNVIYIDDGGVDEG